MARNQLVATSSRNSLVTEYVNIDGSGFGFKVLVFVHKYRDYERRARYSPATLEK